MNSSESGSGHYARKLNTNEVEKLNNDKVLLSEFKQNKLEAEAKKNWDLFYKRNKTNFFKDRHWTTREFNEITNNAIELKLHSQNFLWDMYYASIQKFGCDLSRKVLVQKEGIDKPVLLEVGCGVGNFIFPLIEEKTRFFIYACDFSNRAIDFVKENELYSPDVCDAFVFDVSSQDLTNYLSPDSVHIATMIFVLSAIHPSKMTYVLKNIYKVLKPGGLLLIRDYGLYDQAMLRFGPGHKLGDNFYVRQDGTRAYYFSEEYLEELITEVGFKVISNNYVSRKTINVKENISVPRVYIQGKFLKPES